MNLEKDLEKLFKKHSIKKATVIVEIKPIGKKGRGKSSIITMAPTSEEEIENGKAYEKLSEVLGNLDGEAINAAATVITNMMEQHKAIQERVIPQVTWDKIAHGFAEDILPPDDYVKLMAYVELKNAAIVACEYENAASYREKEKEYLQTVMDKIETNKQI
jgi:hypothetical protein